MSDPLLAALSRAEQKDRAVAAILAALERNGWDADRIVRYRLMSYSAKRIAELAGVDVDVIEIVLNERGLI